ncbi:MAG: VIT1/CCC1 transporter family protein [Solirubrobacteraceae bacterium]
MSEPPPEGRDQSVAERWSPGTPGDAGAPSAAVIERLLHAWREEIAASRLYELIAQRTPAREAAILRRMAQAEAGHRRRLEARMRELGIGVPSADTVRMSWWQRLQARIAPVDRLLASAEAAEDEAVDILYHHETGDSTTDALLSDLREEERSHSYAIRELRGQPPVTQEAKPAPALAPDAEPAPTLAQEAERALTLAQEAGVALPAKEKLEPQEKLDRILGREKWHQTSGGWIGDVIYGANDGLAAVFGIVAGVSGATGGSSFVLTAGISGAIASALSMATGAFLAARSEAEVAAANVERERQEIELHPQEEQAELSLFYQLKGIDETTADAMAAQLAKQPDAMLRALATEEFGYTGDNSDPVQSALAAGISTGLGAIVPVIPFFFTTGTVAILVAAAVSLIAHFLVGAAKSLVTLRKWWSAGLEMTLAGVIVGGATFLVGLALPT